MSSSTDSSHEHILSSDNIHHLHHTFFVPSDTQTHTNPTSLEGKS